jgi:hypothetical protein
MNWLQIGLRAIAVAIAIAGVIDPAWTASAPLPQKLVVIRALSTPDREAAAALSAALPGWQIETREHTSRLPCAPGEQCVLVADGSKDVSVPDDLTRPVSLVTVRPIASPNVAVRSVSVSSGHQSAAGVARIELVRTGEIPKSEIRILDGNAVISSAIHEWATGSSAIVDVPWWPLGTGARALTIEVPPVDGERSSIDNHVNVGVNIAAARAPVLVFDARPSWSSTFVRRALEDDGRFTVGYRTRVAPALSAGTLNGRLDVAALDLAAVVVIGAPDALTAEEVALLHRFVSVRGGTLILLPERSPSGAWTQLLPGVWTEHLTATPEAVGPLRAGEVLRADRLPATASVLARSGSAASIVVSPTGNGRIVVSGAMDAWRYRDLDAGPTDSLGASVFDTFWRSLVAESAAAGEALQLSFDRTLAARGSRSRFTIQARRMTPPTSSEASATARCGSEAAATIRLGPAGRVGSFTGELPLATSGSCRIEATIDDRHVTGSIAVADRPAFGVEQTLTKLERRVIASGGVTAAAGQEATIARAVVGEALSPDVAVTVYPMRAWWWILPFAGCLSIEWWLRRRRGLR